MIVLDTHALLWWTQTPEHLGKAATAALRRADRIVVPAIVFWEAALLVRRGRFALKRSQTVAEWAADVLSIPRVFQQPLTAEIAVAAEALEMHADPADRFVVATAAQLKAPLLTKDALIATLPFVRTVW
jgi:PIN domain nuclease of toxin-antitoxin system